MTQCQCTNYVTRVTSDGWLFDVSQISDTAKMLSQAIFGNKTVTMAIFEPVSDGNVGAKTKHISMFLSRLGSFV